MLGLFVGVVLPIPPVVGVADMRRRRRPESYAVHFVGDPRRPRSHGHRKKAVQQWHHKDIQGAVGRARFFAGVHLVPVATGVADIVIAAQNKRDCGVNRGSRRR
uniref:Putative secreted protein n=1 Tax=Ixodes ricinus TaxID=34613 RepID=A0A6B0UHQ0_IXORI